MKNRFEICGNNDRLIPIISLVFYYGSDPWDGPQGLYDMFRLEGNEEEKVVLEKYLPNYKINLVDENKFTRDAGIATDDIVAVGMTYQF